MKTRSGFINWATPLWAVLWVTQSATAKDLLQTDIRGVGRVRVESYVIPGRVPDIRFLDTRGGTLLQFRLGEDGPDEEDSPLAPRVAAMVRPGPAANEPLIVVAVANPGGTAIQYSIAVVGV